MAVILGIVAPVFLIVALGYGAAKRGLVDQAGFTGLNTFAFALASPALLFLGGTTGMVGGGRAALAFFVGTAAIMGAYTIARWLAGKLDGVRRATFDNTMLFWHYTVAQGLIGLLLTHGFPRVIGSA